MSAASPAPKPQPAPAAKPGNARTETEDAPSLLAGPVPGPPPADTPRMIEIDDYLKNASDAIQNAIRSQACRLSIESVTSSMSAFSTTSTRHKEWDSTIRMDVLQFRVMARMLEHVNKWSTTTLFWAAADQLQTGKDSQPVNPDELKQQLKKDVEVVWGGAQAAQMTFVRNLYDAMVKLLNLGDWELGYKRLVEREDGLSALLSLCGASGKVAPALAWATLLSAVQNADGSLNLIRIAHVLSRLAMKVKKTKPSSRKSFDVLFWLLADQLAGVESEAGAVGARAPPKAQEQQLLLGALCQLMGFSESHMLSQLLLQLLLLSYSMPSLEAMRAGAPEAVHFVSSVVHACTEASLAAPGELLFAEVQTSLMLASVFMTATPPPLLLQTALDAGLLNLQHKALNATSVRPVQLDLDVLRLMRARENSGVVAKLLNCAQRELNSLIGVVKLTFTVVCGHEDPVARRATILQLSPPALACICLTVHPFMSNASKALAGGTTQAELDVVSRVAGTLVPESLEWFIKLVRAQCLHLVAQWQAFLAPVLELSTHAAMKQALQFGCIGNAPSTNAYAIMFLAGNTHEYRALARSWPRIHRIVADLCEEARGMTKMCPQVASPIKGGLAGFVALDVELSRNLPYAAALQHLAQCITQPEWLSQADRSSALEAAPKEQRASFHAAALAFAPDSNEAAANMRRGLLDKALVNKQRMDTVAFSIGGALFHAVALSCEQNSPVMRQKLTKMSNIYKQVIPMRAVGNLDNTSMYEAFTLACEFMYTGSIEALEDAEVAVNVWMVGASLQIHGLPRYAHRRFLEILPASHIHILPGVYRQAHAARALSRDAADDSEEQGRSLLQAVLELILCKLQVLVKKRVVYKILAEHGESFSDCLAAAVGEILDMGPEPSQIPENLLLFKFKDEADDSPDFWRQLAAGAVIRRGVRAWMRRQREKAALTKSGAVLGAFSHDPKAPSIQMLPPRPSEDLELARVDLSATKTVAGDVQEARRPTGGPVQRVSALPKQTERGKSGRSKSGRVSIVAGPDKTLAATDGDSVAVAGRERSITAGDAAEALIKEELRS